MSYILDALRKAEAQRERGGARRLHAQPLAGSASGEAAGAPRAAGWWWAAAAGVLVVVAWAVGHLGSGGPAPVVQTTPAPAQAAANAQAAQAVSVAQVAPAQAASPVAPVVAPAPAPSSTASGPVQKLQSPLPAALQPTVTASASAFPAIAPVPAVKPPASPKVEVPTRPASAPAVREAEKLPSLDQLPAELQREVPKLAISGAVYSDNAVQRMLIINGQVFGEGSEPAPGLSIEQIRPRSAVLRFRGQRFTVSY